MIVIVRWASLFDRRDFVDRHANQAQRFGTLRLERTRQQADALIESSKDLLNRRFDRAAANFNLFQLNIALAINNQQLPVRVGGGFEL